MDLPRGLGDGLVLRFARREDALAVADFNARIHADDRPEPDEGVRAWTLDLFRGDHPTTGPGDFTIVVDRKGRIVSSLCTISQTWTYTGISFGMGRPEIVGTDPAYRNRGLVRAQMEVVHEISRGRGELAQGITGIPWYYRQFGYEMALDLDGNRQMLWQRVPELKSGQKEQFRLRPATVADIPALDRMYRHFTERQLIARPRTDALWRYEMTGPSEKSHYSHRFQVIETLAGEAVAYADYRVLEWNRMLKVGEFCFLPGAPVYPASAFVCRCLQAEAERLSRKRGQPLKGIKFQLGPDHPVYSALDQALERMPEPYAWYVRVPDLPAFLRHIGPALEARLSGSAIAGHTGALKLNFYTSQYRLEFERGRLAGLETYQPKRFFDGDAFFPGLTFLQLLFGRRSLRELKFAFPDCFTESDEAAVLVDALFPKQPSEPISLG